MKDLDWRAPKGKVNVQVLGTWVFIISIVAVVVAAAVGAWLWLR